MTAGRSALATTAATTPIRSQDVTFNILAPGVVQDQYTLGTTYAIDKQSEVTGTFMYAANNTVTGPSLFAGFFPPPQPAITERSR